MATIALEGMHFYAYHGFYEEERVIGNDFVLDVYVDTELGRAAATDDLFQTVNYELIYFICKQEMSKPTQLLEAVAQRILKRIREQFVQVKSVRVRLKKKNPPLGGRVNHAYVEVSSGAERFSFE